MPEVPAERKVNWYQAAGEALLIVLGVALALGGQAWWESRADSHAERQILSGIRGDLSRDSADLVLALGYARGRFIGAERLLAHIGDADAGTPPPGQTVFGEIDISAYFDGMLADFDGREWSPTEALLLTASVVSFAQGDISRAAFDEAVASGQLGVVTDDALRSQISYYYFDAQRNARSADSRVGAQWAQFRRALADAGISPGANAPADIGVALRDAPRLLAELKNLRALALYQTVTLRRSLAAVASLVEAIEAQPSQVLGAF